MKLIALLFLALAAVACIVVCSTRASGTADAEAAPIFGLRIPPGYRDWKLISVAHEEGNNKVFGRAQSFVAGSATNVQFMVKDSKKYASTGGWGFAQFNNGKPADEALLKTCFPCHQPVKAQDFVFTHYAP
jgi:hypothetical protein